MNNKRRAQVKDILGIVSDLRSVLEEIRENEQEAFDNMPENLQASKKGERVEEIISNLEEAVSAFVDIEEFLEEAVG